MARMDKITLFIDTNVLLDHLANRKGFCDDAAIIFSMVNDGIVKGVISSLSIVNCAYVLPKHYDKHAVIEKIMKMSRLFTISCIDDKVIKKAANLSPYDFEDAVQYISSLPYKPDFIITRDKKGFQDFPIKVMTPSEFITACKN